MSMGFNGWMGFVAGEDENTVLLDTRPEHEVMPGTLHFAVLTTLAEVAASRAASASVVPSSLHVQLMRRAVPGRLVGKGSLLKRGKRLISCEGAVYQDDQLVAKVAVQFAALG